MPELPEVETARRLIADEGLQRRIAGVDDSDTFVGRPHAPGELRAALTGRMLTAARRRGKTMWCETSEDGPDLGIHLGMGGRIVITAADTGDVIAARHPGGTCPRCGAEMRHGAAGGRSTWWCSREQALLSS
jgi:formamidopyrimidine-DNA glycosylase